MLKYDHIVGLALSVAGVAMMASLPLGPIRAAHGATLTPHRAFYEMQLGDADQNASVQAVSGRSAFTLDRDCSGWLSNEEYVIEFQGKEGNLNRILSSFESWESDTGEMYSFDVSERSSFQSAKDFSKNGFINENISLQNDLQNIVKRENPSVFNALNLLRNLDKSLFFSMSGSGPSCFAIFDNLKIAKEIYYQNIEIFKKYGYDSWFCNFCNTGVTFT